MAEFSGIKVGTTLLEILPEVQQNAFRSAAMSAGTQFAREMGKQFGAQLNQQIAKDATPALSSLATGAREAAGHIVSGMNQASVAIGRLSTQIALTAFGFQLIGQNIQRYVTVPLATLTAGLLKFGITGAASLEANAILMKNIVGDTGDYKQIFGDLVKLAIKSPVFDTEQLTKYSAQLAGAGFETKKLLPFMTSLGNIFLSNGLDANQASQSLLALTQMYSKGKISGQELNVQLRNAFPGAMKIFNQAAHNLGVAGVEELISSIADGKITMDQFFDELTRIGSTPEMIKKAADAAGGLRSSWIQLKETLKTKFSMAFLDENFRLKPEFKDAFDRISALVMGLADIFIAMIPKILAEAQKFLSWVEDLKNKFDELDPKTKEMIKNFVVMLAVSGPLSTALGIAGIMLGTLVRGFAFFLLNPIGLIITGIALTVGGLALAFIEGWRRSEDFRKGVQTFVEVVRDGWERHIKPSLQGVVDKIRQDLIPAFNDLLHSLGFDSWQELAKWLGTNVVASADMLVRELGTLVEWITTVIKIVTFVIDIFKFLGDAWNQTVAGITAGIAVWKMGFDLAKQSIINVLNNLKTEWTTFKDFLALTWMLIELRVIQAKDNIVSTWNTLVSGIKTAWDQIKEMFKHPIEAVLTFYNTGIGGLWNAARNIFPSLPEFKPAPEHLASGGPVPRVPGISGDWVPLYGTAGEYMLSKKNVSALGGISGVESILSGAQHFAEGGPIIPGPLGALASGVMGAVKDIMPGEFLVNKLVSALTGGLTGEIDKLGNLLGGMPKAAAKAIFDAAIGMIKGMDVASGNIGSGGEAIDRIIGMAQQSGIRYTVNSTYRPGDPGYHGQKKAVDFGGSMTPLARYFMKFSGSLLELIHGDSASYVKNGRVVGPGFYGAATEAQHASWGGNEHVHVAMNGNAGVGGGGTGDVAGAMGGMSGSLSGWIAAAQKYVSIEWLQGLSTLIMRESGGNPGTINLWDSNAQSGHPSGGLMQTIGPTFARFRDPRLPNNMFDPVANIVAGMNYIHSRYGSLYNVPQAHAEMSPQGYDSGGWLKPGLFNGTGVPEPVFTGSQWEILKNNMSSNDPGIINVFLNSEPFDAIVERNNQDIAGVFRRGRK